MIQRAAFLSKINEAFALYPIVAILGPRQCGKTTLARTYIANGKPENYFDLEDQTDLARLSDPKLALSALSGMITIDEIQRIPELFPTLRVLVDQVKCSQQFLILGSASRQLIRQSSESLAGRIGYLELTPFTYPEARDLNRLWLRGGFPRSYLANSDAASNTWRKDYIRTFLEQELPNLGIRIAAQNLTRFWMMLAHYHGNILNSSEIGGSLGIGSKTVRHYIDILIDCLMLRQLKPWFANISKRQVKSPKIYIRDSGILHILMAIQDQSELLTHPKLGASWEGLALEEVIRTHQADPNECYFWATHSNAELDLLLNKDNKRLGFEFKYTGTPKLTKSMRIAMNDLALDQLTVIYPGEHDFPLAENVMARSLTNYLAA